MNKRIWNGKRYWLIGASEGLGRALAHELSRAGCEVVVSARSVDRLQSLVAELPSKAMAIPVDVTDRNSVESAASEIGELDGVVYLAGVYWPMSAYEWSNEKADLMGEINFLGASRVVGAVIGNMLRRGRGHIVLTGSLSGFRGLPGAIGYCSSKSGMMSLAESMQADLWNSPVEVQLINPGFIKTRLTDKNDFNMPFILSAEDAAVEMRKHMETGKFKKSFPTIFSWVFRLSQFLPDWAYFRLFGRK